MHKTAPKSAPRIGIVTTWIESAYWTTVISGIVDVLRAKGALALCFTWGVPEPNEDSAPDALHPFYELCSSESVSGVILLAPAAFPQSAAAFCERRRPLPLVAVGQKVMQVPSVWVHNAAGTRKMIDHLAERCGRRRIAFIRGTEANAEAEARFRAYEDVCVEHSLELDPKLVAQGRFTAASGRRAAEQLLDVGSDSLPDAIMAANDLMAIGALEAVRARGLRVPEDIAVVGFDDLEASQSDPPLTTVRQPVYELGQRAAELVLAQLRGEPVPERELFSPELVVRASCGGGEVHNERPASEPPPQRSGEHRLFADPGPQALRGHGLDSASVLLRALRDELAPHLRRKSQLQTRVSELLGALELGFEYSRLEVQSYQRALHTARQQALGRVRHQALHAASTEDLLEHLTEILPALSIDSFYMVLFDRPPPPLDEARLVLAYAGGEPGPVQSGGEKFSARALLPLNLDASADNPVWFVEPLPAAGVLLGYAVMRGEVYDAQLLGDVCRLLASALHKLSQ